MDNLWGASGEAGKGQSPSNTIDRIRPEAVVRANPALSRIHTCSCITVDAQRVPSNVIYRETGEA